MLQLQIAATPENQVRCVAIFSPDSSNASSNMAHLASASLHNTADMPIDTRCDLLVPGYLANSASIRSVNFASSGSTSGAKRATGLPERSTRNFSKFHSTSGSGFGVTPNSIRC